MSDDPLILRRDKSILHLIMNRPDVHNAFDDHQIARLTEALNEAATDTKVRIVVLSSTGKSFSAGGDLNYMRRMSSNSYAENLTDANALATLMKTLNFFPKPTIAKVQGAARGGGVGLISCCDIAIGSDSANLSLSEVKVGMVPATIAPYVIKAIGEKAARRLFLTAEILNAEQAKVAGFLSEVVGDDQLDSTVEELANSLLNNAPEGMRQAKQAVFNYADGAVTEEMIASTVKLIADVRNSDEGKEGLSAFLEKRKPNW